MATVQCARIAGFKQSDWDEGDDPVFVYPNRKHAKPPLAGALGMPELSPMCLGPVEHGEPGVPTALTLENYHQAAKLYRKEAVDDDGTPSDAFRELRDALYRSSEPRRHKFTRAERNDVLCSVRVDASGKERRFSYLESRAFYCAHYEHLARTTPQYEQLRTLHRDEGRSLVIVGYDGWPLRTDDDDAWRDYCDTSKPFGHERVLVCMLRGTRPWWRFIRENRERYEGFFGLDGEQE